MKNKQPKKLNQKSKRVRLNPKDRRRQLLKIAIKITAEKGLGFAKHSDIAEVAGVAVSTVFFYFPSTDDLDFAIVSDVSKFVNSNSFESYLKKSEPLSFINHVEAYIEEFYKVIESNQDYLTIFIYWSGALNHPSWKMFVEFRKNQVASLEEMIKRAQLTNEVNKELDSIATAQLIIANLLMIFRLNYYGDSDKAIELVVDSLKALLKP